MIGISVRTLQQLRFAVLLAMSLFVGLGAGDWLSEVAAVYSPTFHAAADSCVASCTSQPKFVKLIVQHDILDDEDAEPQPAGPSYLVFIVAGWTVAGVVAAAYLFKYLQRRPPDLYALHVNYRF